MLAQGFLGLLFDAAPHLGCFYNFSSSALQRHLLKRHLTLSEICVTPALQDWLWWNEHAMMCAEAAARQDQSVGTSGRDTPLGAPGLHFIIYSQGIIPRNYFILAYIKTFWPNYFSQLGGFASLASPPTTYVIITSEKSEKWFFRKDFICITWKYSGGIHIVIQPFRMVLPRVKVTPSSFKTFQGVLVWNRGLNGRFASSCSPLKLIWLLRKRKLRQKQPMCLLKVPF